MFGWFRSKATCPVSPDDRVWLDDRFAWLLEEFGRDTLRRVRVILPTPEFFPDVYNATEEDARKMLDRVCQYMEVRTNRVQLSFYEEHHPVHEGNWQGTAGLYTEIEGKHLVWIESGNLDNPLNMVATMAHELGHVRLLGERRVSHDTEDHEPLTDLLTVFLGFGVISANAVLSESSWDHGAMAGWSMSRKGYLSMAMYGYALALFARTRGEEKPSWAKELRADVRSAFWQTHRFLEETTNESNR